MTILLRRPAFKSAERLLQPVKRYLLLQTDMYLTFLLLSTLAGLAAVTLIGSLGAIASRKLNFRYSGLTIISLAVYMGIGYFVSGVAGLSMAMLVALIVGFYDATAGVKLSKLFRANLLPLEEEMMNKLTTEFYLGVMAVLSLLFSFMGFGLRMLLS